MPKTQIPKWFTVAAGGLVALTLLIVGTSTWLLFGLKPTAGPTYGQAPASEGLREYRVYFENDLLDPAVTCEKAFPTTRRTNREDLLRTAIEDLLRGPSESDRIAGFASAIPEGVSLNSAEVREGVAVLDFSEGLDRVAGSCRVSLIRAQIEETAKAAAGVSEVRISVQGRSDDILQP